MRLIFGRNAAMLTFGTSLLPVAGNKTSFTDYLVGEYADESLFLSSSTTKINEPLPTSQSVLKNGLMNFRASPLPEKLQQAVGSSDDFMLSLDMLFPNAPRTYDIKVNQEGLNGINSKFVSQTQSSTVEGTDIGLQFSPKKLHSILIKVEFEMEEEPNPTEEPIQYSISNAPTASQTIAPEETSYYGSRLEKCPNASGKNCVYLPVEHSAMSTAALFRVEK